MTQPSQDDAWKIFNRDTEAGRLLSRLYGVAPAGRVSYPKQRRRRRATNTKPRSANPGDDEGKTDPGRSWKTTYTVHGWSKEAEEEKERERKENISRAMSLAVPKVGRGEQRHTHSGTASSIKINSLPRRKSALTCRNTIEETMQKNRHYRPPNAKNMTEEKERYLELTVNNSNKPADGARRTISKKSDAPIRPSTLFDQIYHEIVERRQHQMALEEIGAGDATRETTAYEIKERLEHLKRLDPTRALAVVQKLMKS